MADNRVIGRDNGLVWRLSSDLRHFRALTLGRPVLMGRRTYDSIGKPLTGRQTIVLTRDASFGPKGVHIAHDLPSALAMGRAIGHDLQADSIVIAGGGDLYRQAMVTADRIMLTLVHASPPGDTHFPVIDPARFQEISRERHPAGPQDEYGFDFITYARIAEASMNRPEPS